MFIDFSLFAFLYRLLFVLLVLADDFSLIDLTSLNIINGTTWLWICDDDRLLRLDFRLGHPFLVEQKISFLVQGTFFAHTSYVWVVTFVPSIVSRRFAIGEIMTTICWRALMDDDTIQIIDFILHMFCLRDYLAVAVAVLLARLLKLLAWLVNMTTGVVFHVEFDRVAYVLGDLLAEHVKPFNCDNQNVGCVRHWKSFRRVLQWLANGTHVLVVLRQAIDLEKLVKGLSKGAFFPSGQWEVECKCFVESVASVVAFFTSYLWP